MFNFKLLNKPSSASPTHKEGSIEAFFESLKTAELTLSVQNLAEISPLHTPERPLSQTNTDVRVNPEATRSSRSNSNPPDNGQYYVPAAPASAKKVNNKRIARANVGTFPMPAYLAKSLMMHLGQAIENAANKIKETNSPLSQQKGNKMTEASKVLLDKASSGEIQTTLPAIYAINVGNLGNLGTIAEILSIKRDSHGKTPNTLLRTLAKAGQAFLAENPTSLMRRYVLLTQFLSVADLMAGSNYDVVISDAEKHLESTVSLMKALRKDVMRKLYPAGQSASLTEVTGCIDTLVQLIEKHVDDALLMRVLLIACLDKLTDEQFSGLNVKIKSKIWALNDIDENDSQRKLRAPLIALLAHKTEGEDPRQLVNSLLELTYFQHGIYVNNYAADTHLKKIIPATLHLTTCLAYFSKPEEKQKKQVVPALALIATETAMDIFSDTSSVSTGRLRLSKTLPGYLQAALTWGLDADPVTALTLSILNGNSVLDRQGNLVREGVAIWNEVLNQHLFSSSIAAINITMISALSSYENLAGFWNHIARLDNLKDRIKLYEAMVVFAEALLKHIEQEQAQSSEVNGPIAALCKTVQDCVTYLQTVLVPQGMEESLKNAVGVNNFGRNPDKEKALSYEKLQPFDSGLIAREELDYDDLLFEVFPDASRPTNQVSLIEYVNQAIGAQHSENYVNQYIKPHYLASKKLMDLNDRAKAFGEALVTACYPEKDEEATESIKKIRTEVYGVNISDPRSTAFNAVFQGHINSGVQGADQAAEFFIKVLFTAEHYPLDQKKSDEKAANFCAKIAESYKDVGTRSDLELESAWKSLENEFYNADALGRLFQFYLEEFPENALKIAIFGFVDVNKKLHQEEKLKFAQYIISAFANLAKKMQPFEIAVRSDVIYLKQALVLLVQGPRFISARECAAIQALQSTKEYFDENNAVYPEIAECLENLSLAIEEQSYVQAEWDDEKNEYQCNQQMLLGNPISREPRAAYQDAIQDDAALQKAADIIRKGVEDADFSREVVANYKEFQKLVGDVAQICFPLGRRYYQNVPGITSENRKATISIDSGKAEEYINRYKLNNTLTRDISEFQQTQYRVEIDLYKLTNRDRYQDNGRTLLLQKCREKILALLTNEEGKIKDSLTPQSLQDAMNELRTEVLDGGSENIAEVFAVIPAEMELLRQKDFKQNYLESQVINAFLQRFKAIFKAVKAPVSSNYDYRVSRRISVRLHPGTLLNPTNIQTQVFQSEVEQAVVDAVAWLQSDPCKHLSSDVDLVSVPASVALVLGIQALDQVTVNEYRNLLLEVGKGRKFAYRVRLIRQLNLQACIYDCLLSPHEDENYNYTELSEFLAELKARAAVEHEKHDPRYPQNLEDIVWAVAEVAIKQKISNGNNDEFYKGLIGALEKCGYEWNDLLVIGFKRYAAMNDDQRIDVEEGIALLNVLSYIAEPLESFVIDGAGQDKNIISMANASILALQEFRKETYGLLNTGSATYKHNSKAVYGSQVYYHIYTLAQAYMASPHLKIEEDSGVELDSDDANAFVKTAQKAIVLLAKLHALLKDPTFSVWHQKILTNGHAFPSALHVLVGGKEYEDVLHHQRQEVSELENRPPIWAQAYNLKTIDKPRQAAYEAAATYWLHRILMSPSNALEPQRGVSILEQQALILMAAHHWYTKNPLSPFVNAIHLVANSQIDEAEVVQREEESNYIQNNDNTLENIAERQAKIRQGMSGEYANQIIDILVNKACNSFVVTVMNPEWAKQHLTSKESRVLEKQIIALLNLATKNSTTNNSWLQLYFPGEALQLFQAYLKQLFACSSVNIQPEYEKLLLDALPQDERFSISTVLINSWMHSFNKKPNEDEKRRFYREVGYHLCGLYKINIEQVSGTIFDPEGKAILQLPPSVQTVYLAFGLECRQVVPNLGIVPPLSSPSSSSSLGSNYAATFHNRSSSSETPSNEDLNARRGNNDYDSAVPM